MMAFLPCNMYEPISGVNAKEIYLLLYFDALIMLFTFTHTLTYSKKGRSFEGDDSIFLHPYTVVLDLCSSVGSQVHSCTELYCHTL